MHECKNVWGRGQWYRIVDVQRREPWSLLVEAADVALDAVAADALTSGCVGAGALSCQHHGQISAPACDRCKYTTLLVPHSHNTSHRPLRIHYTAVFAMEEHREV